MAWLRQAGRWELVLLALAWVAVERTDGLGVVQSAQRLGNDATAPAGPSSLPFLISANDRFGRGVASLGDVDGDGVSDVAVGASGDFTGGTGAGAVYILFFRANHTVKGFAKVANDAGAAFSASPASDAFGTAVASVGDVNGDGVPDLAVGAPGDGTGGANTGAAFVVFLSLGGAPLPGVAAARLGSAASSSSGLGGSLSAGDGFGSALCGLGDLDGDGVPDLAVGASGTQNAGGAKAVGAVHLLLLFADGSVKSHSRLSQKGGDAVSLPFGLAAFDSFGCSVASVGDLDGDGVDDLAVGAYGDSVGGASFGGAVYLLGLTAQGSLKPNAWGKVSASTLPAGTVGSGDYFGFAVSGTPGSPHAGAQLLVGASGADPGGLSGVGAAVLLSGLKADNEGTGDGSGAWSTASVGRVDVINQVTAPPLSGLVGTGDVFGGSVAAAGDLNGDGVGDFLVGVRTSL
jgi:hypothetical protein